MRTAAEKLRQSWIELASLGYSSWIHVNFDAGNGHLRVHKDGEGCLHLMIPMLGDLEIPVELSTRALGVLETLKVNESGKGIRFLDMVCRQANCNDAFVGITEKIVDRIEGGSDPVFSVKEVVSEFKEMLKSISSANLSRAEIIGLLGELYLLRKVVQINPGGLKNWSGPVGKPQDFVASGAAIEVKSSVARGRSVKISSLEQLQPPGSSDLHLAMFLFDENPQGNLSLPILIKEIEGVGVDLDLFESRLAMVGYHREKEEYYSEFLFCFREELFYLVDDEFPKLTRRNQLGDIPLQVTSVNYEINLNGPTPQVLEDNAVVVDLIRRMANG